MDIARSAILVLMVSVPAMFIEEDWHGRPMMIIQRLISGLCRLSWWQCPLWPAG